MSKRLWGSLLVFIFTGLATNAIAAPQARLDASRISGVAPLAVHFDATRTTDTNTSLEPFRQLDYRFTFDDPGSGNWSYSGKSKNQQEGGPLAAHVFDEPGTYNVNLLVTNPQGATSSRQVTISVQDPDSVFSGSNTVCISRTSSMSGCPSGSQQITNASDWPEFESNHRYMLRSGQNFQSLGKIRFGQLQTTQLISFGSGSKPVVGDIDLQTSHKNWNGSWINDARVIGLSTGSIYNGITGENLLIYKNTINASDSEIHLGGAFGYHQRNGHYTGSLTTPKNNFVVENINTQSDQRAFGRGQQIWMGNRFDNAWEHNIRLWQVYKTVVAHNLLEGQGPNPDRPGRSNLKIHSAGLEPVIMDQPVSNGSSPSSKYLVVANNVLGSVEDEGVWNSVTYKPQNSSEVEGCEFGIVENNLHIRNSKDGFWASGVFGGRNITQRGAQVQNSDTGNQINSVVSNNVSQLPNSWDGPYYISGTEYNPDENPPDTGGGSDTDGDGVEDSADNCPLVSNANQADSDGDGVGNSCETTDPIVDTDGDGIEDSADNCPLVSNANQADSDGDGVGNSCESQDPTGDTDGDGVPDAEDNCPFTANPGQYDPNKDGIGEACASQNPIIDADGDGVEDSADNCPLVSNANQADSDGDGVGNSCETTDPIVDTDGDGIEDSVDNCPLVSNSNQADSDGDGVGNSCESQDPTGDTDGDGVPDAEDNCPFTANPGQYDPNKDGIGEACASQNPIIDTDGDGVEDSADNCPLVSNANQADSDGDGVGNSCETTDPIVDTDGDGIEDSVDNCPLVSNSNQADSDGDGVGNSCESQDPAGDTDGDGVPDAEDNCPFTANPGQYDPNRDGIGEACASQNPIIDTDGDGIEDSEDNCPFVFNSKQKDKDNDGIGDKCESQSVTDTDGDGVNNDLDNCLYVRNSDQADTDGDGIGNKCDRPAQKECFPIFSGQNLTIICD